MNTFLSLGFESVDQFRMTTKVGSSREKKGCECPE